MESTLPYFVAGDENRLAAYVCQSDAVIQLAQPLLVIGPPGCGKTAIALHLAAKLTANMNLGGEASAVKYLTSSDFAREYADAVAADDLQHLREMIHEAPILILDDVHTIAGKSAAQDEISMRLDRRFAAGKPTILTSKRLLSETRGIRSQLASRAVMGLTIPIQLPTGESRRVLLRELAILRDVEVNE